MLIAGAGMAGLCAGARARELGIHPLLIEKGDRPGGSMLLSSCVIWRHLTFEDFRRECPGGDERLQRTVFDGFDEALEWLVSLGPEVVWEETPNPLTTGKRFDPRSLTDALLRAAGEVRLEQRLPPEAQAPLVLATGGFPVRYAREHKLLVRSNPWSEGEGFDFAHARGAEIAGDLQEFYGRAMPAPPARWGEAELVDHAQLYGRFATVLDEQGARIPHASADWSENALVQEVARRGGRAWYVVDRNDLGRETPYGTVAEAIERVRAAGGTVEHRDGQVAVHVVAAVTHTIGGLAIDERARVVDRDHAAIPGLYAAGVDAGGWSTGGYASGLAAALVFGLAAAEEIAS